MDTKHTHALLPDTAQFAQVVAQRIQQQTEELAEQWEHPQGTPTRHIVIDDLLPTVAAQEICSVFPKNAAWAQRDTFRERKKTFAKLETVNPLIAAITDAFHSDLVLAAVKGITQIDALEADPELYAGGISMMSKGDFLNPHIDNSHDSKRQRYRRLNLLYYVSADWELGYGGNFELWDDRVLIPKVIQSKFNRLLIMETNRHSWHSVNPVQIDGDRCCISNYYFSSSSPEGRPYYHVTSFLGRPQQTALRLYGRVDNFMRQWVAVLTKRSRGKPLARYK